MNNKFIVTDKRTPALGKVIFFFGRFSACWLYSCPLLSASHLLMFESCVLFGQQVSFTWTVGLFYLDTRSLLLMFESCALFGHWAS